MTSFPPEWANMRVALSHDWLTGMRGGERVLELLCRAFPSAPVYALFADMARVSDEIRSHEIRLSPLQHIPGITRFYRNLLPLYPLAVRAQRPPEADLLISTSHCAAKALRTRPGTKHICYCFTPMRYAWTFREEYLGGSRMKALFARPALALLRQWDRKTASGVDHFVAISRHVQDRILRFYGREADVIYPFVDTDRCTPGSEPHCGFDLIVSALVPYKRIDLAVEAYRRLGTPLLVVGTGTEFQRMQHNLPPNVEFCGWKSDADILELYRKCRLLVFPGEEDFGIVPLEAQACGKPVVAFGRGGALETIREGVTGMFFSEQTPEALESAVRACAARRWNAASIRAHAMTFGPDRFVDGIASVIRRCIGR